MSDPKNYNVGWICPTVAGYVAAQGFLDEVHLGPEYLAPNNKCDYVLGRIGEHNVVIANFPLGEYGMCPAAIVAVDMTHSFPNVRIGLLVGIGGGVPSPNHDIRLGDVVVSTPVDGHGGVLQYDIGKSMQSQSLQTTGFLDQPPYVLRAAVSGLLAKYELDGNQLAEMVTGVLEKRPRLQKKYKRPDPKTDRLYWSHIIHCPDPDIGSDCAQVCGDDESCLVSRHPRTADDDITVVHYGLVASANTLMEDASIRDVLAEKKNVLCFEAEAAGLMNHFPCLVIRGVCNYADSHKSKHWEGYAAMVAAAYARDLLYKMIPRHIQMEKKIIEVLSASE